MFLSIRPHFVLGLHFEEFRRQENQVRALVSSLGVSPHRLAVPAVLRKDPLSSAIFLDEANDEGEEPLCTPVFQYRRKIYRRELIRRCRRLTRHKIISSFQFKNSWRCLRSVRKDGCELAATPDAHPALISGILSGLYHPPGWHNHPAVADRVRSMTTDEYRRTRLRLICYLCYAIGHVSRSCSIHPIKSAYQVLNSWHNLTDAERSHVGSASIRNGDCPVVIPWTLLYTYSMSICKGLTTAYLNVPDVVIFVQ